MNNPLLNNLGFSEPWFSLSAGLDLVLMLGSLLFVAYCAFARPKNFARPAFTIAVLVLLLYQLPLVFFSPLFYHHLPNAGLFAASIHAAVIVNLLWVHFTPGLSLKSGDGQPQHYQNSYFQGFVFWFPIGIFFTLLALYSYRIPFTCNALYALLADQDLTLLVREIIGKLMGRTYAPHVLNVLTSAVGPIVAFLAAGRLYYDYGKKKWAWVIVWAALIAMAIITPLLGGAKGAMVPMAVALSVTGYLLARSWKWKILIVSGVIVTFMVMILTIKVLQESNFGKGDYQFGNCVAKLDVCDRTKSLLESLRPPKTYYGLSRTRLNELGDEFSASCKKGAIESIPLTEPLGSNAGTPPMPSVMTHIKGIIYRVFATPIQVASWHYLYVSEAGKPGPLGLSIAKVFSENYINVPVKVCELYYAGDKTSACTAPTSYVFTYPAYLGIAGLLLACLATLIFDVVVSLLLRHLDKPFVDLTIGIMTIATVNFVVADFTTVIISHGAGVAIAILAIIGLYTHFKNRKLT